MMSISVISRAPSFEITFAMALLKHYSCSMRIDMEQRHRYKIKDCHRNQTFVGVMKKDPNTYAWTWEGHIDFEDGHEFAFVSQRSFPTHVEAEDYMRQFARARIDSRLAGTQPF
jgi:hypothetical protein